MAKEVNVSLDKVEIMELLELVEKRVTVLSFSTTPISLRVAKDLRDKLKAARSSFDSEEDLPF